MWVGAAERLAVTEDAVWVLGGGAVRRVDIATGAVGQPVPTGGAIDAIVAGDGYLWLLHTTQQTVTRLDLRTQELKGRPIKVGPKPVSLAYSERGLYVLNSGDRTITYVATTSGEVSESPYRLPAGQEVFHVLVDNDVIYVSSLDGIIRVRQADDGHGSPSDRRRSRLGRGRGHAVGGAAAAQGAAPDQPDQR